MRIETISVKVHRNARAYTNDEIYLSVSLDDGDDWKTIEARLRWEAVELIEKHWLEYEAREREKREMSMLRRNEWVKRFVGEHPDESPCPVCDWEDCAGCPRHDGIPF